MASQVKKQAWYLVAAAALASALGAAIESQIIPSPYQGLAVALSMFLGTLVHPPANPPAPAAHLDMEELLSELHRRRRTETIPPPPPPPTPKV